MAQKIILAVVIGLLFGVAGLSSNAQAAPPGPTELKESIETSRTTIATYGKILREYDNEMRTTVGTDPTSMRRREEIRILKRYYVQEIESLKAKIIDDYKRIQEYRNAGEK